MKGPTEDLTQKNQEIDTLKSELRALEQRAREFGEQRQRSIDEVERLRLKVAERSESIRELQSQISSVMLQRSSRDSEISLLKDKLRALESNMIGLMVALARVGAINMVLLWIWLRLWLLLWEWSKARGKRAPIWMRSRNTNRLTDWLVNPPSVGRRQLHKLLAGKAFSCILPRVAPNSAPRSVIDWTSGLVKHALAVAWNWLLCWDLPAPRGPAVSWNLSALVAPRRSAKYYWSVAFPRIA